MVNKDSNPLTDQENFWAGTFGEAYIDRNNSNSLLASNLDFFSRSLKCAGPINSCCEFGANIGMNLKAIQLLMPLVKITGVEINQKAAGELARLIGKENTFVGSISEYEVKTTVDLALIKGVLIHINPEQLPNVYQTLYESSHRYILVAEYYNRTPIEISYRGHTGKLFKRDFAGELLDLFPDLQLLDYGFAYHRDRKFPQDDISWFLLEK